MGRTGRPTSLTPPGPPPVTDPYGLDLKPGGDHYRAYIGPPADYDLIAGQTLGLLFAAGLRETDQLLDLGCGSLRAGRMLIPYLRPGNYYGIEPNEWLVRDGIAHELGDHLIALKRPTFRYVDDFSADAFGVDFDVILAQSIFSHTYPDLTRRGFRRVAKALTPTGVMLATFVEDGPEAPPGDGWLYPGCVPYSWPEIRRMLRETGLTGRKVAWAHPRQTWFVAGSDPVNVERIARTVRPPHRPRERAS